MTDQRRQRRKPPSRWYGPLGLAGILVIGLIGWIAYRANTGLPLQSRYHVSVLVPDADRLITSADVRTGGVLVGEVLKISARRAAAGSPPDARIELAIDPSLGRLPVDSTVQIRPASVLGLTYVDLTLGRSDRTIPPGGTLPLSAAKPSSDLTDLFQIFNGRAAAAFRRSVTGLADGVAGRGIDINRTIGSLASLTTPLHSLARTLASSSTGLASFLHSYETLVAALAPVDPDLRRLVVGGATTLQALVSARSALGSTIVAAPAAESATTNAFIRARPALDGLATLSDDLEPGGRLIPVALRAINRTLSAGIDPLRRVPGFAGPLTTAVRSLDRLSVDPQTSHALQKLHDLIVPTNGVMSVLGPEQEDCNGISLWGQGFSNAFTSSGDGEGPALATVVLMTAGAAGEELQNPKPSFDVGSNPLPHENASECEAGNEPWSGRQQLNNPPSLQSATTRATTPPPGVLRLARAAGLLKAIPGT